ncbi:hypothetical protein JCM21531_1377 [Acetivibrio straminisolvens JCM 21531]|uniref:Uncharacterized protein n=1 Tax=Acetivibrio straminisolvens JCM 21531 TaxID=1294263 RepID=W4V4B2_9FIRM|nr:hypothetical protein JCM21531_1377 [Acetivibrio straminisolvens JCM 21531]
MSNVEKKRREKWVFRSIDKGGINKYNDTNRMIISKLKFQIRGETMSESKKLNKQGLTEEQFLAAYDASKFDRPSMTVDMLILQ